MNQLCLCCPWASPMTEHSDSSSKERETKPSLPGRQPYKHGVHWRMHEILSQECESRDQLRRLMNFVHKILDNNAAESGPGFSRHDDPTILHTILDALANEEEARESCRELLKILEKNGFNMSLLHTSKDTPLLRAIKTGNRAAVDALLYTKCDINATDRYSSTCLIYAVKGYDRDTVRTILKRFPFTVNLDKADYANYTALAYAASNNSLELCALLLEAGARTDVNSTSPLFLAVSNDASLELIQLLISKGASVNVSNSEGLNAVAAAARNRKPEIVSLLLDNGASFSTAWHKTRAFLIALNRDHLEILKILMHHGIDVTCLNPKGSTVVHEACSHGSSRFLHHLVKTTDINLDIRNRQGCSAAHYATQQGYSACLEVLFYAGGDCWSSDLRGQSTLEIALFNNRSESVSFLAQYPVFPRHTLFSTLHMLRNDYDPEALSRKPAVALFASLLQNKWGEGDQVDTLFNTCVIVIRRILRQNPASKVAKLPLPKKVKDQILSYK